MKVLIYTAMNNRHTLCRLWAMGITRFIKAAPEGFECKVLAVISEDESVPLCKEFGFEMLRHPNRPLGKKFNAGLQYAIEKMEWDYMLLMGDDDFISNEAWGMYAEMMQNNYPYFGFSSIYFYSPAQQKARIFDYAMQGCPNKLIGCGRVFSRQALEMVSYYLPVKFNVSYNAGGSSYPPNKPVLLPFFKADYLHKLKLCEIAADKPTFIFWKDEQEKGLDNESEMRLINFGILPIALQTEKPLMTDIKTSMNMWGLDHFISVGKAALPGAALAILSEDERQYITEHLLIDENELRMESETIPLPEHYMVGDNEELFMQRRYRTLLDTFFEKRTGRKMQDISKITAVPFKDATNYFEYWENFKNPFRKFIVGIHTQREGNEVTFTFNEAGTKLRDEVLAQV